MTYTHPASIRRNAKDSVFCDMFSRKEYLLDLYRDLHPEDHSVAEDDIDLIAVDNATATDPYNNLCFTACGRLIILIETQCWSNNFPVQMLIYLADAYRELLSKTPGALCGIRPVKTPSPELYVVYTGKSNVPRHVSFAENCISGQQVIFNLIVDVITTSNGILGEYFKFSHVFDEMASGEGSLRNRVQAVFDRCRQNGVLDAYLSTYMVKAFDIMYDMFEQDAAVRWHEKELREKVKAEGRAIGFEKGLVEGRAESFAHSVKSLMSNQQLTLDEAKEILDIPEDIRETVEALL